MWGYAWEAPTEAVALARVRGVGEGRRPGAQEGVADNVAARPLALGAHGRASGLERTSPGTVPPLHVRLRRREGRPGRARGRGGAGLLFPLPHCIPLT